MTLEVLLNPDYFGVDSKDIATTTSDLNFWTMPPVMVYHLISGFVYDLFGRRVAILITLLLGGIFTFLTPFTAPSIYPWFLIIKILYTMFTQPHTNIFVNDYIQVNSRGKILSLSQVISTLAHIFTIGVIYRHTHHLDPIIIYSIGGGWCVFLGILLPFMIREPTSTDASISHIDQ